MKGSRGGAGDGYFSESMTDGRRDGLRVAAIGMLSGVLYVVGYAAEWAVFRNGQHANVAGAVVQGAPPDGARLAIELGVYWGATTLLFALYAWILILCRRGSLRDGRAALLALSFPVLFNVGLLFGRPFQSMDALTYVAHGFMGGARSISTLTEGQPQSWRTGTGRQGLRGSWRPSVGSRSTGRRLTGRCGPGSRSWPLR